MVGMDQMDKAFCNRIKERFNFLKGGLKSSGPPPTYYSRRILGIS